jgi:hypothetical protein
MVRGVQSDDACESSHEQKVPQSHETGNVPSVPGFRRQPAVDPYQNQRRTLEADLQSATALADLPMTTLFSAIF